MSEPAPDPLKPIEANNSAPASSPRLPEDILHLVMEHYVEARLDELENHAQKGPYWGEATQWPVLPLLTSCKAMCNALIPKLYRYTLVPNNRVLNRFLSEPTLTSYRDVRVVDIVQAQEKLEVEDMQMRAMHMMFSHLLKKPEGHLSADLDLVAFKKATSEWTNDFRPRVDTLRLRRGAIHTPLGLLSL